MTPGVLVVALVLASPALYRSFVSGELGVDTGLIYFLLAAAVCWLGRSLLVSLLTSYSASRVSGRLVEARRRQDDRNNDETTLGERDR